MVPTLRELVTSGPNLTCIRQSKLDAPAEMGLWKNREGAPFCLWTQSKVFR